MTTNPPFMNGIPELLILRALAREEMYGYQLAREIRTATDDHIRLSEGVVYPALHAMERAGHLGSTSRTVAGRQRVYYRITPKGRRRLTKLTDDFNRITGAVARAITA